MREVPKAVKRPAYCPKAQPRHGANTVPRHAFDGHRPRVLLSRHILHDTVLVGGFLLDDGERAITVRERAIGTHADSLT